jgi:hypothetical protein
LPLYEQCEAQLKKVTFLIIGVVKTLQTAEELMSFNYIKCALTTFYELQLFFIHENFFISDKSTNFDVCSTTYYKQEKFGFF